MTDLGIYVPTRARAERQITSVLLEAAGVPHTLVAAEDDLREMGGLASDTCRLLLCQARGIRATRQWILEHTKYAGKILMIDDDIRFRKRGGDGRFVRMDSADLPGMLEHLGDLLSSHAHLGMVDEFMCQHRPRGFVERGRYNSVLGYNLDMWPRKPRIKFRTEINEEHDVHLQLGALGLAPAITCEYTRSTKPYAPGGCGTWRTPELELAEHRRLAELWPGLVRVVPVAKNSLSGHAVRINWRKVVKT